jgi:hypothetical protein
MKKVLTLIFINITVVSAVLFASPLSSIMEDAEKNSLVVQNATLTHENSLLTISESALEDSVEITVGSGEMKAVFADGGTLSASPNVKVVLPNDGKTTISANANLQTKADGTSYTVNPGVEVSHSFDFGYSSDTLDAYNESYNQIQTEKTYLTSLNSFRRSTLEQIQQLLEMESRLKNQEKLVADEEKAYNNNLALEVYTATSPSGKKAALDLKKQRATLESYQKQYSSLLEKYKTLTGTEWNGVSDIPSVSIEYTPSENGGSTVILSSLAVSRAEEEVKVLESSFNPNKLMLSAGASETNNKDGFVSTSGNIRADYSVGNFTLGGGLKLEYESSYTTPTLTLSVTWKNNTAAEKNSIELEKKKNALVLAQNSYQEELQNYSDSVTSLEMEIFSYQADLEEAAINTEYLEEVLSYQRELYSLGLTTEDTVKDAEFNLEMDEYTNTVLQLKGLILGLKIEAMNI